MGQRHGSWVTEGSSGNSQAERSGKTNCWTRLSLDSTLPVPWLVRLTLLFIDQMMRKRALLSRVLVAAVRLGGYLAVRIEHFRPPRNPDCMLCSLQNWSNHRTKIGQTIGPATTSPPVDWIARGLRNRTYMNYVWNWSICLSTGSTTTVDLAVLPWRGHRTQFTSLALVSAWLVRGSVPGGWFHV